MCSYNTDICRVCMYNDTNLHNIFSSTPIISSISTAIMECASISISETDTLPHTICTCCLDKLEIAYNFRILCIQSDQTLRNNISGTIVKEEKDENLTITPITKTETLFNYCEIKIEKNENSHTESLSDNDREDIKDLKELNVEKLTKQQPETNFDTEFLSDNDRISDNDRKDVITLKRDQSIATKNVLRQKNDEYFHCEQCPKKYKFIKGFRKHLTSHKNLLFNCDSQKDITALKNKDVKKQAKRQPKTNLKFGQSKPNKKILKRKDDGYFHCEQCPEKYKDIYRFKRHFNSHTNIRFNCDKCDRKFCSTFVLKRHIAVVHATESKYSCEFCGKTFRALNHLRRHHSVHSEIRIYKCKICAKDFKQPSDRQKHLLTHKDERPFVCGECGSSFKRSDHLTVHEQLHTGKRFKCACCGQAFQTKQSMNSHLLKSCRQLS